MHMTANEYQRVKEMYIISILMHNIERRINAYGYEASSVTGNNNELLTT
jgi:hypothetical protein